MEGNKNYCSAIQKRFNKSNFSCALHSMCVSQTVLKKDLQKSLLPRSILSDNQYSESYSLELLQAPSWDPLQFEIKIFFPLHDTPSTPPKLSPGHDTQKNISVLSIKKPTYKYFVVCKFARMLYLKMASFKNHLFYKNGQYSGISNHTAAYLSQSIFANRNLAHFYAIKDYISFYMQIPHKAFSKITLWP